MEKRPPRPAMLVVILVVHLVIAKFVWRDIRRRDPSAIRGSKRLWRIATGANSGASLLYLLVGRKHADATAAPATPVVV